MSLERIRAIQNCSNQKQKKTKPTRNQFCCSSLDRSKRSSAKVAKFEAPVRCNTISANITPAVAKNQKAKFCNRKMCYKSQTKILISLHVRMCVYVCGTCVSEVAEF